MKVRLEDKMKIANVVRLTILAVQLAGTVIGNALLLLFIRKSNQLHRSASLNIIFNCGIADMLSAVINIPVTMDYFLLKTGNLIGPVPTTACIFALSFLTLLTQSAIVIIIIDRILIVKYPAKYMSKVTVRRARRTVIAMWAFVILTSILSAVSRFSQDPILPKDNPFEYITRWYQNQGKSAVFVPFGIVSVSVVLPSAYLYWLIQKRKRISPENDARSQRSHAADRKITASCRTVLFTTVMYFVCYLPLMSITILDWFDVELIAELEYNKGYYFMVFNQMSSLINPYLFILRSSTIRNAAARIVSAQIGRIIIKRQRNQVQDIPQNETKTTAHEVIELQVVQNPEPVLSEPSHYRVTEIAKLCI